MRLCPLKSSLCSLPCFAWFIPTHSRHFAGATPAPRRGPRAGAHGSHLSSPRTLLSSHCRTRVLLSAFMPAAHCPHTGGGGGVHTPQPSSLRVPGASNQIGRCRAGAGIPRPWPAAHPNSTGPRSLTPKPLAMASVPFYPLGLGLPPPPPPQKDQ